MDERRNIPPYLILIETSSGNQEICYTTCLTEAIELAKLQKRMLRIFERDGSVGTSWHYLCDISKGVL